MFKKRKKYKIPLVSGSRLFPRLGKTMSDTKWQYITLIDRLNNPDNYKEIDDDVNAVIENLKMWFNENMSTAKEKLSHEEFNALIRALSVQ